MKQTTELNRVNYALTKHHCEMLREKLDPKLIQSLEVADNPSLNYRNAFKAVYHDELEKTIEYQQMKKQQQKNSIYQPPEPHLTHTPTSSTLTSLQSTLPALPTSPKGKPLFTDYEEERSRKMQELINRGYDGGQSFYRAQDDYLKKRQQEVEYNKYRLEEQMLVKQYKKQQAAEQNYREMEELKENHDRQTQLEQYRILQKKHQMETFGQEVKQQIEQQTIHRQRKSLFQIQAAGRHNPITNPIEYHIDNPYILHKYQLHYP